MFAMVVANCGRVLWNSPCDPAGLVQVSKHPKCLGFLGPATGVIWALRAQKLQIESENEFPGPLGSGAQKVETGGEKESNS